MALTLTLQTQPAAPLEAEVIAPDRLVGLDAAQVAALPVRHGNAAAQLGEFFRVEGELGDPPTIRLIGDLSRVKRIGSAMKAGSLQIEGAIGMHVGAGMTGGEIVVNGDAGDWAGAEMQGGRLTIKGNAGHSLGSAYRGSSRGMLGGEIIVQGRAGDEVGNSMRRGLIAIGGNVGDFAGVNMLAGTILTLGELGWRAGAGLLRGTLITMQPARILPTFSFDCVYRPNYLPLYLRHVRALGLPVQDAHLTGHYRRWSGDMVALGRGELLVLESDKPDLTDSQTL